MEKIIIAFVHTQLLCGIEMHVSAVQICLILYPERKW